MWYILDVDYKMMVLSRILKYAVLMTSGTSWLMAFPCRYFDENSWGLELVHKEETVSTLSSLVQPEVVSQVFDFYTLPVTGGESDDFSVHQEKVSR